MTDQFHNLQSNTGDVLPIIESPDIDHRYSEVHYDLSATPIGKGQIGVVYRGELQPHPTATSMFRSEKVAIKIGSGDYEASSKLKEEYELLKQLRNALTASTRDCIPVAALAKKPATDIYAIVMNLYPDDEILLYQLEELHKAGNYLAAEEKIIQAGVTFCRSMEALHRLQNTKPGYDRYALFDRKAKDIYHQTTTETMTILDWNVLRDIHEEDVTFYRTREIRRFAYIFHELALRTVGQAPFRPFKDDNWQFEEQPVEGVISVALRVILAKCLKSSPFVDNFTHLRETLEHLQKHLRFHRGHTDSAESIRPNNIAHLPHMSLKQEERSAIQKDWEYRTDPHQDELDRKKHLQNKRLNALQAAAEIGGEQMQEVAEAIRQDNHNHAKRLIDDEVSQATDPALQGTWTRWQRLIDGIEYNRRLRIRDKENWKQLLQEVATLGKTLQQPALDMEVIKQENKRLQKLFDSYPDAEPVWQELREELRLRHSISQLQSAYQQGDRETQKDLAAKHPDILNRAESYSRDALHEELNSVEEILTHIQENRLKDEIHTLARRVLEALEQKQHKKIQRLAASIEIQHLKTQHTPAYPGTSLASDPLRPWLETFHLAAYFSQHEDQMSAREFRARIALLQAGRLTRTYADAFQNNELLTELLLTTLGYHLQYPPDNLQERNTRYRQHVEESLLDMVWLTEFDRLIAELQLPSAGQAATARQRMQDATTETSRYTGNNPDIVTDTDAPLDTKTAVLQRPWHLLHLLQDRFPQKAEQLQRALKEHEQLQRFHEQLDDTRARLQKNITGLLDTLENLQRDAETHNIRPDFLLDSLEERIRHLIDDMQPTARDPRVGVQPADAARDDVIRYIDQQMKQIQQDLITRLNTSLAGFEAIKDELRKKYDDKLNEELKHIGELKNNLINLEKVEEQKKHVNEQLSKMDSKLDGLTPIGTLLYEIDTLWEDTLKAPAGEKVRIYWIWFDMLIKNYQISDNFDNWYLQWKKTFTRIKDELSPLLKSDEQRQQLIRGYDEHLQQAMAKANPTRNNHQ